jgi:hypothetical protein
MFASSFLIVDWSESKATLFYFKARPIGGGEF